MSSMGHGSYVANLSIFYIKVGYKQYDTVWVNKIAIYTNIKWIKKTINKIKKQGFKFKNWFALSKQHWVKRIMFFQKIFLKNL